MRDLTILSISIIILALSQLIYIFTSKARIKENTKAINWIIDTLLSKQLKWKQ